MVDCFFTRQYQRITSLFGNLCNLMRNYLRILILRIYTNGFIASQRQCLSDDGFTLCATYMNHMQNN